MFDWVHRSVLFNCCDSGVVFAWTLAWLLTGDNGDDGDTAAEDGEGDSDDVWGDHLVTLIEPGDNTDTV